VTNNVKIAATKDGMRLYLDNDVEVSGRYAGRCTFPFVSKFEPRSRIYAGRDLNAEGV